jgi:hypothetical protein
MKFKNSFGWVYIVNKDTEISVSNPFNIISGSIHNVIDSNAYDTVMNNDDTVWVYSKQGTKITTEKIISFYSNSYKLPVNKRLVYFLNSYKHLDIELIV